VDDEREYEWDLDLGDVGKENGMGTMTEKKEDVVR
jgi:hypothetical protein